MKPVDCLGGAGMFPDCAVCAAAAATGLYRAHKRVRVPVAACVRTVLLSAYAFVERQCGPRT